MTADKLNSLEPLFGCWYVESKVSEGKNSKFYKVCKTDGDEKHYMGLKTVRFPSGEQEISRVIASGKYNNIDEYLDKLQENIVRNMSIMRSLSYHNNIVALHNFTIIRESSCFYLLTLTELLSPLSEYLSFETVSKNDVVNIGKDICRAMEAFRCKGIVHRNITPENIYVDSSGNYKLGDFGAYNYDMSSSEASFYRAPELYNKNFAGDTSSDIYSLGVVLYKLLNNNRLPFLPAYPAAISLSDREQAFARCIRGESFPTPVNSDFSLTTIISKATSFRADERYASPMAMLSRLEAYNPYQHSVPTVAPQQANFEITNNTGIRFDSYEYPQEETYEEEEYDEIYDNEPEDEQPKKRWYFLVFALVIVLALVVALIVKSGSDGKDKTTTESTIVTLAPPTQTTTETTTEETTTEESTTEETTTEETTTETTTESTTESTTQETTTETTTTQPYTEPTLVSTNRKNGDKSSDGKTYMKISSYSVEEIPDDEFFDEIIITIEDNLGENLFGTKVYVYQMSDSTLIQKVSADMECEISEDYDGNVLCTITVEDSDFYYEPEYFQYFLCFEEGAIVSDTVITLPLQIRIEQKF